MRRILASVVAVGFAAVVGVAAEEQAQRPLSPVVPAVTRSALQTVDLVGKITQTTLKVEDTEVALYTLTTTNGVAIPLRDAIGVDFAPFVDKNVKLVAEGRTLSAGDQATFKFKKVLSVTEEKPAPAK